MASFAIEIFSFFSGMAIFVIIMKTFFTRMAKFFIVMFTYLFDFVTVSRTQASLTLVLRVKVGRVSDTSTVLSSPYRGRRASFFASPSAGDSKFAFVTLPKPRSWARYTFIIDLLPGENRRNNICGLRVK